ncbi:hypothetical protein A3D09_03375 [Candidatus Collierbacteria bacterium RIFCSPHIGHO2_02_FULL_49_10]|uniref:Uncharacterized protein n=1 Tax=Candidatus Collierbacteria bacterium RIFCSPHIGHO2_02_FULL_49_10 TaxID=1817723 RepID=A0A1F5EWX6_9BACT|nr:MAG: hypothetical protein A3D09_03375 [Candidatus Collierbacteria bacterium RIFCSPHIGHO2_02_FULL_49_10]
MPEKRNGKQFEYPPTKKEVYRAMRQQALISFRFHTDPRVTVEEYAAALETALAPLKKYKGTEKYTLEELAILAGIPENKRLRRLYEHEGNHAQQIRRVVAGMGMDTIPEFVVYYCPIMADMYQFGNAVGLIETSGITGLDREQLIEFETRLTFQMMRTTQNSVGDLYIIGAVIFAKVISHFRQPK